MDIKDIIKIIENIGFSIENGKSNVWAKTYCNDTYRIQINIGTSKADSTIDYGKQIKADRRTTMSFSKEENIVVLECVNRLLEQGYKPETIILEKAYLVGHDYKFLDILVTHNKKAYMMIECKTVGREFEKSKNELANKGGQLMSYWVQDRDAKILVLYTAQFKKNDIEVMYSALETNPLYGSNLKEVYNSWDKNLFDTGIFDGEPYKLKERYLKVYDLKDMLSADGGRIFNAFREILRRHVISDKPNAFNKIFNLFICKVQDEEKEEKDAILDFQWHSEEDAEKVLNRLNDLYKKGVKEYLKMEVADHSIDEFEYKLNIMNESDKVELKKIFNELRLYKNNEFAFIEVYDRKTFLQNAEVVRDVVRLLQKKRIRYTHKQPFMGDFFERLLATSVKQESGQYFTPIPIAKFICDSLPVEEIVERKIQENDPKYLPYIIDYAAGSGHFLTEGMDRVDEILQIVGKKSGLTRSQKANYNSWRENYLWAKEFVYGIEKDYRLAKTAKVSCFLNGDGEANIICGDGLDNFSKSIEYKENGGILSLPDKVENKDNQVFDVVIANPPYSVWQCKLTVKDGAESFDLWDRFTENSDDIECLFAERTKQLLKNNGVAGVIFPVSILSSGGIEENTREILLKYFEIKGIVYLGSATFMKANVATAVLFMKRRTEAIWKSIELLVNRFFELWKDITINKIPNAVTCYANYVWRLELKEYTEFIINKDKYNKNNIIFSHYIDKFISLNEIKSFTKSKKFNNLSKEEKENELNSKIYKFIIEKESEKMLYFLLTFNQKVVVASAPSSILGQKEFLGYEFNERMGYEGLWPVNGDKIDSVLYDEENRHNPNKINTLIHDNFNDKKIIIPKCIEKFVSVESLSDLMDYEANEFDKSISKAVKNKKNTIKENVIKVGELVEYFQGVTFGKNDQRLKDTKNKILTATHIDRIEHKLIDESAIFIDEAINIPEKMKLMKNDIFISTANTQELLGKYAFVKENTDAYAGGFCAILRDKKLDATKYLQLFLNNVEYKTIITKQSNVASICNFNRDSFLNWEIPYLEKEKREKIIKKFFKMNDLEDIHKSRIKQLKDEINDNIWRLLQVGDENNSSLIGEHFIVNPSKTEIKDLKISDNEDVTFLPMSAINTEGEIIAPQIKKYGQVKKGYTYFRDGDILFAKITPCMENGKGTIAKTLKNGIGFGSTEFHVLRKNGILDSRILFYFLQNNRFRKEAELHMTGKAGQRRVPKEYLKKYKILIPSEKQQIELLDSIKYNENLVRKHEKAINRIIEMKKEFINKNLGIEYETII
ncbi:N-6 DNA methylase [Clostridium botulinum]|uniref:N-6 DNA methylase n=1 Tax=Clostridium botulinum TaxID=1491 RepID=UPI0009476161|nr:N-6 DNA methylase [Clostridium botulinum]APQ95763.1 eco57I restriction-modification methylase family protein [Clostridium botulinum]MBN3363495.1 hypothetical protein [Clostridium botulinum]